ncbi:MAG: hypothetical protein ONB32_09740 [candidate division KSB1 bacterium]|nr:hypothetical protein [candidate division KSB1 bacterium]MDZ7400269.1 hypothetical protein [candidate division KSB1 bacterium]
MKNFNSHQSFSLESFARKGSNYYQQMVDANGQPYFNIFWTDPAEAAHDWPDFADVTARQLQAVIMLRRMTGMELPIEKIWLNNLLALIDPASGLIQRPNTHYAHGDNGDSFLGDQALTLYALATAYLDNPDEKLRLIILKLIAGIDRYIKTTRKEKDILMFGFLVKSLIVSARYLHSEQALALSAWIVRKIFDEDLLFTPDNQFHRGSHVHSMLRTLVGVADYAVYAGDPIIFSRANSLYQSFKKLSTRFGFIPEVVHRQGDLVACETCALMDYVGLAVTLANHGHNEYWGDVERIVRNHLIESQVTDASWLRSDNSREDTEQFTWRDIDKRMIGGYAGWSSPTHLLAYEETLTWWGGAELKNKIRAFQNCCAGSGTHALFIAWKNIARFEDDTLSIHLHLDKLLPQAEIRCYQPFQGFLTIHLKQSCYLQVRIPDFVSPQQLTIESDHQAIEPMVWRNFVRLGYREAGEMIKISYPLPIRTETEMIGNPGFRQYPYQVTWKGDTVLRIEPLGKNYDTGYSEVEGKEVRCYYGEQGPGRLYQRDDWLQDKPVTLTKLFLDDVTLDIWKIK